MTHAERFLAAMKNQIPDRVPVTPDISFYIPCKKQGIPFWDILFYNAVPLWKAYLEAVDYFGIDAWTGGHMSLMPTCDQARFVETVDTYYDKSQDAMIRKRRVKTPDGEMTSAEVCFRFEPPTFVEKPIKSLPEDWPKFKHLLRMPSGYDKPLVDRMREECRKRQQAFGLGIGYPGFHNWSWYTQKGIEEMALAEMDCPEILQEWFEIEMAIGDKMMDWMIAEKPDYIFFGGSGTITCASPDLAMKYAIPALKKWSAMAKQAGLPTLLHSCGKQMVLLDMLCRHTDVNCANPLEAPPMGDVDLAQAKRKYGDKIALMGNLHTTEVMLFGSPQQVLEASRKAIEDAGANGGFILSSGDQCPRETPDENIFAMLQAAEKYGKY